MDLFILLWFPLVSASIEYSDIWEQVGCDQYFMPDGCGRPNLLLESADDYDKCAPAYLNVDTRNYFLAASGRRYTYRENKAAFRRIQIMPRVLRNVVPNSMATAVLNQYIDFPIGFSPVALQKLAHPDGELATVTAISEYKMVMILSSYASTSIRDVAARANKRKTHLWMQTYIFNDKQITLNLVRRAEYNGFKAIVVTVDSPIDAAVTCDSRNQVQLPSNVKLENMNFTIGGTDGQQDASATFADIAWLKANTRLPIVAKGILSGEDAKNAILAGASAILVSNHGGRQLDGAPATIDALPDVVSAVNTLYPKRDVYLDGGVRSGHDVYKAIARGAKMVFLGRPIIWGLALGGSEGVKDMLNLLVTEFNQTMLISGASSLSEIKINTLIPQKPRRD